MEYAVLFYALVYIYLKEFIDLTTFFCDVLWTHSEIYFVGAHFVVMSAIDCLAFGTSWRTPTVVSVLHASII